MDIQKPFVFGKDSELFPTLLADRRNVRKLDDKVQLDETTHSLTQLFSLAEKQGLFPEKSQYLCKAG